jgi:hypothetical protein
MKLALALGIAAALGASAALAQDFRNPGGDVGPPGPGPSAYPPPGYPPPAYPAAAYPAAGARPLDPPGSGPVGSGVQVIGPPMGPDNQYVPSQSPLVPYASHPTVPTVICDGGWIAGAGVLILQPHWSNNPAYERVGSNAAETLQTNQRVDFDMGAAAAPLIWLGYVGENGFGIRARWSRFYDKSSLSLNSPAQGDPTISTYSAYPAGVGFSPVPSSSPDYNDAFTFASDLTMDVTDLEILWDLHPARGSLLFGAGLRYAHLAQNYDATWVSTATPLASTQDKFTETLVSGHNFSGAGPVVSVEAGYPLGTSGFRFLGGARGSLLFGTGRQQADLLVTDTEGGGNLYSPALTSNSASVGGVLPVLEFELGADWGHNLGAYRFAIQTAMIGQLWFYGGNASNTTGAFGSSYSQQIPNNQETLGLVGARIAASMSY